VVLPLFSLLMLCSPLSAAADPIASTQLKDGDRVVLVGGTLIEREQRYGYWETALTLAHPKINLHVRNLGWSGDTVFGDARAGFGAAADGYKLLKEQIVAAKPTVLLIAYGGNEAFVGAAGLRRFRDGLARLLNDLAPLHARTLLLAPLLHERSPIRINDQIMVYRHTVKELARERHLAVADLLCSPQGEPIAPQHAWTDDGMHLNALGYAQTAQYFCRLFFPSRPIIVPDQMAKAGGKEAPIERLRKAIVEKNGDYFNRYRPENETYLFGFRKYEQGQNAGEIPQFDKLVTEAENRIFELRNAIK
jgi:lysophospholipase L1-like esterase